MAKPPSMPKADPKTAALFRTLLPLDDRVTVRPMFGHTAAFVNGNMFAGTFGPEVFVRVGDPARAELLAIPGAAPFAPMQNRPMKEYVQVPSSLLAEPSTAKLWVVRALEWTATLPARASARKQGRRSALKSKKTGLSKKRR
jgi:TfoX/Sxy family transcriptional regulator of competence genes